MAFNIRYRLRDSDGNIVKSKPNICVAVTPDGMPFIVDTSDYYVSVQWRSCKGYTLEVATNKVDGKWDYQPA